MSARPRQVFFTGGAPASPSATTASSHCPSRTEFPQARHRAGTIRSVEHKEPDTVVFDIGGVLLDWDPRYLYGKLFRDEAEMERFLAEVCTPEWHAGNDRGVPFAQSSAELAARHPGQEELILAWGQRSEEMEGGEIQGSVEILAELLGAGIPCYALTNMERETFPRRMERYPFMRWFTGTVASFQEGVVKPDPEIFRRLLSRFALDPWATVMIDDSLANLGTAAAVGMRTIHFRSSEQLRGSLEQLGLPARKHSG